MIFSPHMHIGIIGNGKMGHGIFQYLSEFEFQLSIVCEEEEQADALKATFQKKTARLLKNGIITAEQAEHRLRAISINSDLSILSTADLIIEAIPEVIDLKRKLFSRIEKIAKPSCIFTSNTSSIPPSELFSGIRNKENCAGLHFFYPVSLKDLAEINASPSTSAETIQFLNSLLNYTGKFHLKLAEPDTFIINKIFLGIQSEACTILNEGLISAEEIDALADEYIFPGGIFLFFDHVGIDIMYASVGNYTAKLSERENFLDILNRLKLLAGNGMLGVKSGKGFYDHSNGTISIRKRELLSTSVYVSCLARLKTAFYQSLHAIIRKGICSKEQLDFIIKEYTGAEKGPFENSIQN